MVTPILAADSLTTFQTAFLANPLRQFRDREAVVRSLGGQLRISDVLMMIDDDPIMGITAHLETTS